MLVWAPFFGDDEPVYGLSHHSLSGIICVYSVPVTCLALCVSTVYSLRRLRRMSTSAELLLHLLRSAPNDLAHAIKVVPWVTPGWGDVHEVLGCLHVEIFNFHIFPLDFPPFTSSLAFYCRRWHLLAVLFFAHIRYTSKSHPGLNYATDRTNERH